MLTLLTKFYIITPAPTRFFLFPVIECKECKNSSNKLLTNILNCDTLEQEKTIPVTFNNYTRCNLNFTHNINKVCYATAPVWLWNIIALNFFVFYINFLELCKYNNTIAGKIFFALSTDFVNKHSKMNLPNLCRLLWKQWNTRTFVDDNKPGHRL